MQEYSGNSNATGTGTGEVTRFAGQALENPSKLPIEVQLGSRKDLPVKWPGMMKSRGAIQSNINNTQGTKSRDSIVRNQDGGRIKDRGSIRQNQSGGNLRDRGSIQQNQRPSGHLEPTTLEGFEV